MLHLVPRDKKLPYSLDNKRKVKKVKFNSTVKGPDGTEIEVEGYVIPKPDGTPDYIQTHYPKFNSDSKNIVKEK